MAVVQHPAAHERAAGARAGIPAVLVMSDLGAQAEYASRGAGQGQLAGMRSASTEILPETSFGRATAAFVSASVIPRKLKPALAQAADLTAGSTARAAVSRRVLEQSAVEELPVGRSNIAKHVPTALVYPPLLAVPAATARAVADAAARAVRSYSTLSAMAMRIAPPVTNAWR